MARTLSDRQAADRRQGERRGTRDRRQVRIDALQAELAPLRAAVEEHVQQIREIEKEQRTQLVRIAQIQREIDDLKKA